MGCLICASLEQAYKARLSEYIKAPFLGVLSGQHTARGPDECRDGARPLRTGRAPVCMPLRHSQACPAAAAGSTGEFENSGGLILGPCDCVTSGMERRLQTGCCAGVHARICSGIIIKSQSLSIS